MRKLTLVILAVILSNAAFGQLHFGIKGGLNYTKMNQINAPHKTDDGYTVASPDFKPGFHIGAFAEIGLVAFSVQPEIMYSQKGFEYTSEAGKISSTLNYIDVPVLLKFKPIPLVHAYIGPQVSFLLADDYDYDEEQLDFAKWDAETTEFSGVVGVGVSLGKLDISGRYNFGLSPVFGKDDNFSKDKNQVIQLSLGLRLL